MSEPVDLEQVITDSVNDAAVDETPDVDVSTADDTPAEPVEAPVEASSDEPAPEAEASLEVSSPASQKPAEAKSEEPQDEFSKLAGVPQMGVGGRENRIPYSRVKKITEKAVGDLAEAALGRKLNPGEKAVDVVKSHVAQIPELTAKVTDYESRLDAVGQFENVMANDPQKFLTMLARIPAYREFFEFVENAQQVMQGNQPAQQPQGQAPVATNPEDVMPEPDEELSDGSKVYSMEGLKKLLAWNAAQAEARITAKYETKLKEIDARYGPMAQKWQERERIEATLPVIRKQIEEARQWPLFNESEAEILGALRKDTGISLEAAYRQVVFPKLVAERNKVRQEVIKEAQSAPTSTAVPVRAASRPSAPTAGGARNLEDIIKEQVESIRR